MSDPFEFTPLAENAANPEVNINDNFAAAKTKFDSVDDEIAALQADGGGGIEEAPNDGKQYARQNETWAEVLATGGGGGGGGSGKSARLFNPPLAAEFNSSFATVGPITLTDDADIGLLLETAAPNPAADRLAGKFIAVPASGNWSATLGILPNLLCYSLSGASYAGNGAGLLLNGDGGHVQFFGVERMESRLEPFLTMKRFNGNGSAFISTLLGPLNVSDDICYLRVEYNAAQSRTYYYYSRNGKQFVSLGSYANNDHGDARKIDKIGPGFQQSGNGNNAGRPSQMSVPYWLKSWT